MHLQILIGGSRILIDSHTPGQTCDHAVGLNIEEISPSAHRLSDEQAKASHIGPCRKGYMLYTCKNISGNHRGDNAAVDGEAPVPDPHHSYEI
ncbi:hypothetical protein SDC9_157203 [bioreactor metagenome]|uniref:Uncharacterized protein n=1 Tax=bioreactor metagenome TaxID=1076179 RepID=A0A645F7P6_9ZZZZ